MRKELRWICPDQNRDHGKIFVIKEMSATAAEKWATRALIALAKAGMEVSQETLDAGFAAVAIMSLKALGNMDFNDAQALMDEMFKCVRIQPGSDPRIIRDLVEEDIEEIGTRFKLRLEVFNLHAGFSLAGSPSPNAQDQTGTPARSNTPVTPTSRGQSRPVSRLGRRPSRS